VREKLYKHSNGGINAAIDFVGSNNSKAFGLDVLTAQGHMAVVGLFRGVAKLFVSLALIKRPRRYGFLSGEIEVI